MTPDSLSAAPFVLRGLLRVQGFTFAPVEGHGPQDDRDPLLSARDRVVGYTPQVRVDLVFRDEDLGPVLEALRASNCGITGRCVYWVTTIGSFGRI